MTAEDNDKGTFELTRRRALGGLATIGAASAVAGAGTMAAFSDTEESENNGVSAGTLNLEPTGSSDGSSFNISASDLAPGEQTEVGYLDLQNVGSIDGELDYAITDVTDIENGRNDAEIEAGDNSGGSGELSNFLEFRAFVDRSPNAGGRDEDVALTSGWVGLSGGVVDTNVPVAAGEEVRIYIDVRFIDHPNDDRAQGDEALIDADFILKQPQP
jgi:predicted ribosomally synthesized peptide with SipW-like signal peptide